MTALAAVLIVAGVGCLALLVWAFIAEIRYLADPEQPDENPDAA